MAPLSTSRPVNRHASHRGFSLIKLSVVVAIVTAIVALAVPVARQSIFQARSDAVKNDLHAFAAAFRAYASEHGDWPPGDGRPGTFPEGMADHLAKTSWTRPSPIGGHYAWDPNSVQLGGRYRAVIAIVSTPGDSVTSDRVQLLQIDRTLDDGNLNEGVFLLGYRNFPIYVLEH